MFSHIMIGSNDIERSKRFYDAVLGVFGAGEPMRNENATGQTRLFYRHNGSTFCISEPINGKAACGANGGTNGSSGTHGAELLIPQTEMLTLFQAHRHSIISWLDKNAELADEVFEAVERTLSYTGSRRRTPSDPPARQWMRLGSHGRFMPASEQRAAEASRMRTQLDASRDG